MVERPPRITARQLRWYLDNVELPRRSVEGDPDAAGIVMRSGAFVGSVIEHHEALDRAMLRARELIVGQETKHVSVNSGTVILADRLAAGKGRFTRSWHAPAGGLWGAMIYVNTLLPASRMLLPLAVGISCCEALRESGAENAVIRWINDVLVDGKKIAGFLLEGFYGPVSGEEYLLIGFGVNLNNRDFPQELDGQAISLHEHLGRQADLETFSYRFLAKLCWNIGLLCFEEQRRLRDEDGSASPAGHPLLERWRALTDTLGRRVLFGFDVVKDPQYRATAAGIAADGGLQLVLDDGSQTVEYSGEIRYLS